MSARRPSSQHQSRDVHARYQEDKSDCPEKDHQRLLFFTNQVFDDWYYPGSHTLVCIGVLVTQSIGDPGKLRLRLRNSDAWTHTTDDVQHSSITFLRRSCILR